MGAPRAGERHRAPGELASRPPDGGRRAVGIGLIGLGTVGSGVVRLLAKQRADLRRRLGVDLVLRRVAIRDLERPRAVDLPRAIFTTDAADLVNDPSIDVVIEVAGGIEPARTLILEAIRAGKDVVTANKLLLAEHGTEIFAAAERHGGRVGFEASVGGGIPIIRVLRESLAGDRNRAIYGIVNGTCNSILTAMSERGAERDAALAEAQASGLAEADPSLDVDGTDSAHKLALLATLAFRASCPIGAIHTEGIRSITQLDVSFARELGYVVKLLAIAKDDGKRIEVRVHPTMIPRNHLLADVRDATNAIHVQGDALGGTTYVGQGAGSFPTATSVVADLIEVARSRASGQREPRPPLGVPVKQLRRVRIRPIGAIETEAYLRFLVVDRPGVLAAIAGRLGRHQISIASVIQRERRRGTSVPIVIRTHPARGANLRRALDEIAALKSVRARPLLIRIEELKESGSDVPHTPRTSADG